MIKQGVFLGCGDRQGFFILQLKRMTSTVKNQDGKFNKTNA